jgi:DNA polymerase-3 subunit delta'
MAELLPWHQRQWTGLIARLRSGTFPHALLLTGPAGLGKRQFAESLAQAVLCQQPREDGQACGSCRSCLLYVAGSHPDHLAVSPEQDSKVIKIGQIRSLIASLGLKSQLSGFRVALITPAERMNTEAANSLLKTLEEPGERTLLMLVSTQPGFLPATVRSRCQKIVFARPPRELAEPWLLNQAQVDDPGLLLALADGAPLAALALAEGGGLARRASLLKDLEDVIGGRRDPLAVAEQWQNENVAESIDWLRSWIMDLIRLKATVAPPTLANRDLKQHLQPIAKQVDLKALYGHFDRLQQAARLANSQVSNQSILEEVLIPWRNAIRGR